MDAKGELRGKPESPVDGEREEEEGGEGEVVVVEEEEYIYLDWHCDRERKQNPPHSTPRKL